jgi:Skp family chaperone for outer membrane proteins
LKSRFVRRSDLFRRGLGALFLASGLCLAQVAEAQQVTRVPANRVQSPVLTIDSEAVFLQSEFGQRVVAEIEARGAELAAENRKIEAALEQEERDLTELRETTDPDEFRELADAFDQKVQETRAEQAAKGRAINALLDEEREVFLTAAAPVLERLMQRADAAVILERRSVFVSANAIDITEDAIALLNETLGSGTVPKAD